MDKIEFVSEEYLIEPVINGLRLKNLAETVELPFAGPRAGDYFGLDLREIPSPGDHYRGRPTLTWFNDGDTVLLGCGCGEWGCWPLTADVHCGEQMVTWSNFRNGHRTNWDLSRLGPFEFDRVEYDEAVDRVALRRG